MAESSKLCLVFDPPASDEALSAFLATFRAADYDAPIDAIGPAGTAVSRSPWLAHHIDGDVAVYYRSPFVDGAVLASMLTAHGISGRGWIYDDHYGERCSPPHDSERFVFGATLVREVSPSLREATDADLLAELARRGLRSEP